MATEENSGGAVVGIVEKPKRGLFKPPKLHFKHGKRIATALLLVLVVGGAFYGVHAYQKKRQQETRIDHAKLIALDVNNDCRTSSLNSISKEQPNKGQVDDSILLLNFRAFCLEKSGKFKEANSLLAQVKNYYAMNHDTVDINLTNEQITVNNKAMIPPSTQTKAQGQDIDPASLQRLKQQEVQQ